MIYFTSDTHYGHAGIIPVCKRPFVDVDQMTDCLVRNWNACVQPTDTVYHLGDFFWMNGNKARPIAERLNGRKLWVKGNHDSKDHIKKCGDLFEWVKDYHEESFNFAYDGDDGEKKDAVIHVVMCHFPILSWHRMAYGAWMLHGHCHGSLGPERGLRYDVGVDFNGMCPVSLEQLVGTMALRSVVPVDYHTAR